MQLPVRFRPGSENLAIFLRTEGHTPTNLGVSGGAWFAEGGSGGLVQRAAGRAEHDCGHCMLQWLQPGGFPYDEPVLHRPRLLQVHVLQDVQGELPNVSLLFRVPVAPPSGLAVTARLSSVPGHHSNHQQACT